MDNSDLNDMIIIGKNIRTICMDKKITFQELSEKSHISSSALYNILTGDANPRFSTLQAIAQALNISLSTLMSDGDAKENSDLEKEFSSIIVEAEKLSANQKKLLMLFFKALQQDLS